MMKTAKQVKKLALWAGDARLFELSEPIKYEDGDTVYVVVSAVQAPFTGPETYIFAADGEGEVIDWGELAGSYRGALDHAEALEDAGYTIIA